MLICQNDADDHWSYYQHCRQRPLREVQLLIPLRLQTTRSIRSRELVQRRNLVKHRPPLNITGTGEPYNYFPRILRIFFGTVNLREVNPSYTVFANNVGSFGANLLAIRYTAAASACCMCFRVLNKMVPIVPPWKDLVLRFRHTR